MNRSNVVRVFSIAFVLAMTLAFSSGIVAQSKNDIKRAKALAEQGDKAFNAKNYRAAADLYGQAATIVPTNPYCHFWKGYSHYYLKEYEASEREYVLALTQGYKPIDLYKVRWLLFAEQKRYDEAIADLKKALDLEPRNLYLLKALGDAQFLRGGYAEAQEAYQRALLIAPKDGDLYYSIASVHSKTGNIKDQGTSADEAIKRGTQYVGDAYYLLADSLDRQKNVAGAIDAYQRTISAKPGLYQPYLSLASLYQKQNKMALAIETLKKGLIVFPSDGTLYTNISWYYSLADRPADAVQAALSATKILPDQYMGFTNLCRAYNETTQYKEAMAACNNALRLQPNDGETLFYRGRANDKLKKTADATADYRRAVTGLAQFTKNNPEDSDGFYLLGNAYFADSQIDRAIEAYTRCLQLNSSFVKARFNLGYMLVLKKDKAGAMTQYSFLLAQDTALAGKLKAEIDKL